MSPFNLDDEDEQPIEIEIQDIDPETGEETYMSYSEGTEEVPEFDANLSEYLDESYLSSLASDLIADYENDKNSRKDWEDTYKDGLELLGLKYDERMEPWPGACGINHPLLLEAVVRFQAEMITETLPAGGPAAGEGRPAACACRDRREAIGRGAGGAHRGRDRTRRLRDRRLAGHPRSGAHPGSDHHPAQPRDRAGRALARTARPPEQGID